MLSFQADASICIKSISTSHRCIIMYTKMSTKGCIGEWYTVAEPGRALVLLLCTTLLLPRLLRFWTSAEEEANGCALEAECLTQLVLQVAFVGEMQCLWVVDEKDESRWVHLRLRRIEIFSTFPRNTVGLWRRTASRTTSLRREVGMRR